ncbi:Rieske 2Fe-2S domain-containing protein [Immundisolibacter sp.]|uniref:Rieske 2Fe-2S domain-containing protein n=1 Tax=Immundisolibacter sp. TaxID=1934948 RepID=UPI0035680895
MAVIDVGRDSARINQLYYEHIPELGIPNYWYPVARAKDIREQPTPKTLHGAPVALLRRNGKIYAVANECPHRGTRLHKGSCEFPGSNTLTCRYHGWTFDVTSGALVGVLTDGPDSPMTGKARLRTYPVEERQGIVWLWLGDRKPVPVEDDIPPGLLMASEVHVVQRECYGNWRWHAENPGLGHATMLHRDSAYMRFVDFFGYGKRLQPVLMHEGLDGEWLQERFDDVGKGEHYPGLGPWPRRRFGEVIQIQELKPTLGVSTIVSIRLPGVVRINNYPFQGAMYYEWFVQTDPDHYLYFQVDCGFPKTVAQRLKYLFHYYAWGRFIGIVRFTMQDIDMVGDSHDLCKKQGHNDPVALFRPDHFHLAWRKYAMANLRGGPVPGFEDARSAPS